MRDAGRQHQRVEIEPFAQRVAHAHAGRFRGRARARRVVPGAHLGAHCGKRLSGRQPVAAEPHHGEPLTGKQVGGECAGHRIFNVASPASARMTEMIQNRMTMVGSAQPFFSKW